MTKPKLATDERRGLGPSPRPSATDGSSVDAGAGPTFLSASAPMTNLKHGDTVVADGAKWRVLAAGATENGATYVHLVSVAEGIQQRNGWRPKQCCGWLRDGRLLEAP